MIPFNKPPYTGNENQYIIESINSSKISGDGKFSKRCYEWFEKKLKQYGVPVPPPEDKYPKLHNAWVNQTTKDLPKMYGDFNKLFNMDYSQLLDPIYYFYKPQFLNY